MSKQGLESLNEELNGLVVKIALGKRFGDSKDGDVFQKLKEDIMNAQDTLIKSIEKRYYK